MAELHAGDIGAVAKLKDTLTGDTLGDKAAPIVFPKVKLAEPAISFAIEPKSRGDEDKLSTAIHRMLEEDLLLRFSRDPQTKEFLLSGAGQQHVEVAVSKLKRRFNIEVTLKAPKIPYRETIRAKAEAQGKHKKQTGGHGQYGDCWIKLEPLARGAGFEFVNDIFGGAIPRNFIPAVEKGIIEAAARGYLAGYPVVDFRVILFDGSYHDVDSSEMAFKLAGSKGFKKCMEQAKPCLLEPIMNVEITVPENYSGDIMGNLNGRRGRIQGMEPKGGSDRGEGPGAAGGNAHLRFRPHLHDPGPRDLLHGEVPLRHRPAANRGQDRRRRTAPAGQGRGRVVRRQLSVVRCQLLVPLVWALRLGAFARGCFPRKTISRQAAKAHLVV